MLPQKGKAVDQKFDWRNVVVLDPKGYLEMNDGHRVTHGPVAGIEIDDHDMVVITLKWAAEAELGPGGIPTTEWRAVQPVPVVAFPNLLVPFIIEPTPEKGNRVRFGLNILYINDVPGLDPARVQGLVLPA